MDAPLLNTAMEVFSRATSNSEVLSLNLTGLIILLVLKVAVVAFGLSGGSLAALTGRASHQAPSMSPSSLTGGLCFLLFTSGEEDKLSCLQRSACEDPTSAKDLLSAAKIWRKMHGIIKAVPYSDQYSQLVEALYSAVRMGEEGEECTQFSW